MTGAKPRAVAVAAVVALLAAGAVVRGVALDRFPVDVHGDEGEVWSEAIRVRDDPHAQFFGFGWFQQPNPSFWLQGIGMDLFGRDYVGLRAGSAIAGTAALAGHAWLAWLAFGPAAAVLSLVPLITYHWHLQLSRTGTTLIQGALLPVWAFALFVRYSQRRTLGSAFACGAMAGLCGLSYPGTRIAPLVIAVMISVETLAEPRRFTERFAAYFTMLAGFVVTFGPVLSTALFEWGAYNSRLSGVAIWNEANWARLSSGGLRSAPAVLFDQTTKAFSMFVSGGDTSLQYGYQGRYVDPFLHGFAIVGFFVALFRIGEPTHRLLVFWFLATVVIGGALTIDPPYTPRVSPVVGVPYLFAAIALLGARESATAAFGAAGRRSWLGLAVVLCTAALAWNAYTYFATYPERFRPGIVTRLAHRLEGIPQDVEIRMVTSPALYWTHGTRRMLCPDRRGRDVVRLDTELAERTASPRLFIAFASDGRTMARLREAFPSGTVLSSGAAHELAFYSVAASP